MARLRCPDPTGDARVPVELLDPQHPTWSDSGMFADWCARHLIVITRIPPPTTWAERHLCAADAWAIANSIVLPGTPAIPDRARLREVGVPRVGALDRAWALAEASIGCRALS